jgi:hypothetical protein
MLTLIDVCRVSAFEYIYIYIYIDMYIHREDISLTVNDLTLFPYELSIDDLLSKGSTLNRR